MATFLRTVESFRSGARTLERAYYTAVATNDVTSELQRAADTTNDDYSARQVQYRAPERTIEAAPAPSSAPQSTEPNTPKA